MISRQLAKATLAAVAAAALHAPACSQRQTPKAPRPAQLRPAAATSESNRMAAVRQRFVELERARSQSESKAKPILAQYRKAARDSVEHRELTVMLRHVRAATHASTAAFERAFAECDSWSRFDPRKEQELLRLGLQSALRDTAEPERAVEACHLFLQHFKDSSQAPHIRGTMLPNALLACGKSDDAIAALEAAMRTASRAESSRLHMLLGDIHLACGRRKDAAASFEHAATLSPTPRTRRHLELRRSHLGAPMPALSAAPTLAAPTWIGCDPSTFAEMRGRIVVATFGATWCSASRQALEDLDSLAAQHSRDGLIAFGITRAYPSGYLPASPAQLHRGGTTLRSIKSADFAAHIRKFRKNAALALPLAISTQQDLERIGARSTPTTFVINRDGKVALAVAGSDSSGLLRFAVRKLLLDR
ncbi:MAG: hypothetical protein AB8H80_16160 [Planctomycetota bacterium]